MTMEAVNCPVCGSSDVRFRPKAVEWECNHCEKRFAEKRPGTPHRLTDKAPNAKRIFFSYGHDSNRELVLLFKEALEERGHEVWFDAKDIGVWDDWKGRITRGIDNSQMAIAFMSKHALRDPGVCRNEIAIALNRFGIVYPVVVEANIQNDIPITIRHLQWPDLSQWQAIREGKVHGENWQRWFESRLIELIEKLEGDATQFAGESQVLRNVLEPSSFDSTFAQHLAGFVGREWIFGAYQKWLRGSPHSRLLWITGGPGVGKTAIAANLAVSERATVVGSWFCDAKSPELKNPEQAIRTLAFQLSLRWEDYRVQLLRRLGISTSTTEIRLDEVRRELGKKATQDQFRMLITEPLANLIWREHKLVLLVDALDEASDEFGNNPMAEFIGTQLGSLPEWLGIVVTSRPDPAVVAQLIGFRPIEIDAQDARNEADLRKWYTENLAKRTELASLSEIDQQRIQDLLIERSQGMFLYLKLVEEGFRENSLAVADLQTIESGLLGLYRNYYSRFRRRAGQDYDASVKPLLVLLLASGGALPEDLANTVLNWSSEQFSVARCWLGSYVVEKPTGLELFHNTLSEWLTQKVSNEFHLDATVGRQQIADVLFNEISERDTHLARWREPIRCWLPTWLPDLTQYSDPIALNWLGTKLTDWGDFSNAEAVLRKALALSQVMPSQKNSETAKTLSSLAALLSATGRYDEAETFFRKALELQKSALEETHPDIARSLINLAELVQFNHRWDEARQLCTEALTIQRANWPDGHPDIAESLSNLARCFAHGAWGSVDFDLTIEDTGPQKKAEQLLQEALAIQKATLPKGHPNIARTLNFLGLTVCDLGRAVEAESLLREALVLQRVHLPATHIDVALTLFNLAGLLHRAFRYPEGESLCREALEIQRASLPADHPDIANTLFRLGNLLKANGNAAEAEKFYAESRAVRQAHNLSNVASTNEATQEVFGGAKSSLDLMCEEMCSLPPEELLTRLDRILLPEMEPVPSKNQRSKLTWLKRPLFIFLLGLGITFISALMWQLLR